MYEEFYGLKIKPFQLVPNPDFLFLSEEHQNALTFLEYGIMERSGFILLTGEVGTGKTLLIRYLLNQIESEMEVAVIFNTNVSSDQLINLILREFELPVSDDNKAQSLDTLYQFLIEEYEKDIRVLLIIDEAQNLSLETLEEVRMLSNLQTEEQMLLQIMLVGQLQLKERLKMDDLAQFSQRITVNYHLTALTREETASYISFRLEKASGENDLFSPEAVDLIYRASSGIPRTINLLCDHALVYGFADELRCIDVPVIEEVIKDKDGVGLTKEDQDTGGGLSSVSRPVDGDMLSQRMQWLEQNLAHLQVQVKSHIEKLEEREERSKNELVAEIKKQLIQERKRTDKLLYEYSRLRAQFDAVKKRLDEKGDTKLKFVYLTTDGMYCCENKKYPSWAALPDSADQEYVVVPVSWSSLWYGDQLKPITEKQRKSMMDQIWRDLVGDSK